MESRIRSALAFYTYTFIGLFLLIAPWTAIWDRTAVGLMPYPLQDWMLAGWARGVVSGLGALDLTAAMQVAVELWGAAAPKKRGGEGRSPPGQG